MASLGAVIGAVAVVAFLVVWFVIKNHRAKK